MINRSLIEVAAENVEFKESIAVSNIIDSAKCTVSFSIEVLSRLQLKMWNSKKA